MKVLLSIKPEFVDEIFAGRKHFEYRKVIFRNENVKTVVVYATKPVGKIVGEFDVAEVLSDCPDELWDRTRDFAGIAQNFFDEYFRGRQLAHAIRVSNVKRYERPVELNSMLPNGYPPQSFCYLT